MISIGRVCIKTSGREKGKIGIVIDVVDKNFVIVDGNLRRKKCNINHLKPLQHFVEIEKNASPEIIKKELSSLGFNIIEKGEKEKRPQEIPQKTEKKESNEDNKKTFTETNKQKNVTESKQ